MIKKIVLVVCILALGAGGYYFYLKQKGALPAAPAARVSSIIQAITQTPAQKLPGGALAADLNSNTIFLLSYFPRNIDPLIQNVGDFTSRLKNTQLWKKLNLDAMLEGLMRSQSAGNLPASSPDEIMALLNQVWAQLQEFSIAVSRETIKLGADVEAPKAYLTAKFTSDTFPNQIGKYIADTILAGQQSVSDPVFSISKAAATNGQQTFFFSFHTPFGTVADSRLRINGSQVYLLFGTTSEGDFLRAEGGHSLAANPAWQKTAGIFSPDSGIMAFIDLPAFLPLMQKAVRAQLPAEEPGKLGAAQEALLQNLGGAESAALSIEFKHTFRAIQCGAFAPGSSVLSAYKDNPLHQSTGRDSFSRLIGRRTIAALHLARPVIESWLELARQNYERSARLAQGNPDWARFLEQLGTIQSALRKLPFTELGVVINAPLAGFSPELAAFVDNSSTLSLENYRDALNEIARAATAGTPNPAPQVQVVSSERGGKELEIKLDEATKFIGSPVSDHAMVISAQRATVEGLNAAYNSSSANREMVLNDAALERAGLADKLRSSASYFFLSTRSVIDMGRPFLPLLLMQRPDLQVTDADIAEVIALLSVDLISIQNAFAANEQTVCSETLMKQLL